MKFEKAPTLAYLCLLPLLIALGIWQLGRSEEKRVFLEKQEQGMASSEILTLSTAIQDDADALRYKKVQATGHYDLAHQFLIDNQISAGKPGYLVLTPFILQGEAKAVLVNRGWVPLNHDRSVLPEVQIKTQQSTVSGRINRFPSVGIKLAGAEIPTEGWPSVLQVIDTQVLAKKLAYPLFPFQVELDKNLPEGFKREWQTTTIMLPEQHIAYAVQWFALAFTLTLLFIWYSCKRRNG
ncbi:MAG: SURF1 family protein [Methylococcales bacterium]|nr:SURF1 family protein [Methylococcales bacterium]MDD5632202.1 SURF1 family protein [Methylococcales bacterium]